MQPPFRQPSSPRGGRAWMHSRVAWGLGSWLACACVGLAALAGWTADFDLAALHAAKSMRAAHPAAVSVWRDLSGFGSTTVLALLSVSVAGWLALRGARARALVVVATAAAGLLADDLAKALAGRARPDAADAAFVVTTHSYPSGHAALSALMFGIFALVLAGRRAPSERRYAFAVATLFAALVGASRVVLGVHWASDVLGGWLFGAGSAMLVSALLARLR